MTENRLLIGIGGIGGSTVNEIAYKVKREKKEEEIPQKIEFVAIDSNKDDLDKLTSIEESFKIKLAVPADKSIKRNIAPFLKDEDFRADGAGAGFQRIFGRALYQWNKPTIIGAIQSVAKRLRENTGKQDFLVIIINSLGGGTGSSMGLEVAMDARAIISKDYNDPTIFGISILPSEGGDEAVDNRANGQAALKELHFLLTQTEHVEIGDKNYSNPYMLHILLGREEKGVNRDKEIREALSRILIDLGFIPATKKELKELIPDEEKGKKFMDMSDVLTAVSDSKNRFSTLGYYEARFPVDELLLYYEIKNRIPEYQDKMEEIESRISENNKKLDSKRDEIETIRNNMRLTQKWIDDIESDQIDILGKGGRTLRRAKESINALNGKMTEAIDDIAALTKENRKLEEKFGRLKREIVDLDEDKKNRLYMKLKSPNNTTMLYQVPLSDKEIEELEDNKANLRIMNFKELMRKLGREVEYYERTHDRIQGITSEPILNYHSDADLSKQYSSGVINTLEGYGFDFLKIDGASVINKDNLLDNVLVAISTDEDNIEEARLGEKTFMRNMIGRFTKKATLKRIKRMRPPTTKHSFAIYSFLLGIHPWALSKERKPQMGEIGWMHKAYENVSDLRLRHSFLYGEPDVFKRLMGAKEKPETEEITNFWKNYVIIDKSVIWNQIPTRIAEGMEKIDKIKDELFSVDAKLRGMPLGEYEPNKVSPAMLVTINRKLSERRDDLRRFNIWIRGLGGDLNSLKKDAEEMSEFIKKTRKVDKDKSKKIIDISKEYGRRVEDASIALRALSDGLDSFTRYLGDVTNFLNNIPAELQTKLVVDSIVKAQEEIEYLAVENEKVKREIENIVFSVSKLSESISSMISEIKEVVAYVEEV